MKTFRMAALCSLALLGLVLTASAQQDVITTVAGGGTIANPSPGSVPSTDLLINKPYGVLADPASADVYFAEFAGATTFVLDSGNGIASSFAGNGTSGFAGDGTAANSFGTELNAPAAFAKDSSGNIYIADVHNCVIREVLASTGVIQTVAGGYDGYEGIYRNGCGFSGNGGPAVNAQLNYAFGLAIDAQDNIYLSEYMYAYGGAHAYCDVRKIAAGTGIITTFAGNETCGYSGDGGLATKAELNGPYDLSFDGSGNLYIADTYNHRIRKVDATTHIITTVAGNGTAGYNGDGTAVGVTLNYPQGVYADPNGNLFIADFANDIVRWVSPTGQLISFGGTHSQHGFSGDGGAATSALLSVPVRITQDSYGNFYIADYGNNRIRKISAFAGMGLSTSSLNFKTQAAGTTSPSQAVTLSAVGPITISKVAITAGYSEKDNCTGVTLAARQTCEIDVSFTPTSTAEVFGTLTVTSNAFFPASGNTVNLRGNIQGLANFGPISVPATSAIFDPDNGPFTGSCNGSGPPAVKAMSFSAGSGRYFQFSATGLVGCCGSNRPEVGPDGYGYTSDSLMNLDAVGSISGYEGSGLALTGVFTNGQPSGSPPADYPYTGPTEPTIFTPVLNQVFFIGDGLTGTNDTSGSPQRFNVPADATELWLGFPDGGGFTGPPGCYVDNVGSVNVWGILYQGPSK